jgi:hypothetical protein
MTEMLDFHMWILDPPLPGATFVVFHLLLEMTPHLNEWRIFVWNIKQLTNWTRHFHIYKMYSVHYTDISQTSPTEFEPCQAKRFLFLYTSLWRNSKWQQFLSSYQPVTISVWTISAFLSTSHNLCVNNFCLPINQSQSLWELFLPCYQPITIIVRTISALLSTNHNHCENNFCLAINQSQSLWEQFPDKVNWVI